MKFSTEARELKEFLVDLVAVASSSGLTTSPLLSHIKIVAEADRAIFMATNHELSLLKYIPTKTALPGMCTVPARSLFDLVKTFIGDKKVTLELTEDTRLRVSHSRSKHNLSSANPAAFFNLNIPLDGYTAFNPDALLNIIHKTSDFMEDEKGVRPILQSTLFEPTSEAGFIRGVTTDGYRLATCKEPGILHAPFLLSRKSTLFISKVLAGKKDCGIFVSNTELSISFDGGVLHTRLLDNKFPNYRTVFPKGQYVNIEAPRMELLASIKRALLFTEAKSGRLSIEVRTPTSFVISSSCQEGDSEEIIDVTTSDNFSGPILLKFNGHYVEELLAKFEKEKISIRSYGCLSPVAFLDGSNLMGIILPLKS